MKQGTSRPSVTFHRENILLGQAVSRHVHVVIFILGSQNGCMPAKYGRFLRNGTPLVNDVVHLGREGLRVFCVNIKRCIIQRGERQTEERFRGGSGDYRGALIRGGRSSIRS